MSTLADFGAEIPDEEAWKDAETLRELYHDKGLDQSEIGDELGCSAGTISYWMDKLGVDTTHTKHSNSRREPQPEDWECEYYEACGNKTPGPRNGLCVECISLSRLRTREHGTPIEFEESVLDNEFTTMVEHFENLYDYYKDSER